MRLDNSVLTTLNIFPLEKVRDKVSSIFGLLNTTITAGIGERLLRRWLRQPLVSAEEINRRLDIVEIFVEENEVREDVRNNALKGIIDIEKYVRRLEGKSKFRLQDLYVMYQTVKKLEPILELLRSVSHEKRPILDSMFVEPLSDLIGSFGPFLQKTESVIDAKSLSLSPPEFNVAPTFDEGLKEIAERKDEAYDAIAHIYDIVGFSLSFHS